MLGVVLLVATVACGQQADPEAADRRTGMSADEILAGTKLSQMPAFANVPWADDLKAEQNRFSASPRPDDSPYGPWSLPDFSGEYTNVSDNQRRSYQATCDCPRKVVWVVGTSAAFGLGQRDDHTIASNLVRLGEQNGLRLEVRNLSVPGMTLHNEVDGVTKHLELDAERPDLIVFYDGFNDFLYEYIYATVHPDSFLEPKDWEGPWLADYLGQAEPPDLDSERIAPLAQHAAASYRKLRDQIAATADGYGVATEFFLQADAFADPTQSAGFEKILNRAMNTVARQRTLPLVLGEIAEALGPAVHNMREVVPSIDEPVFADPAHMNETGSMIIAQHMYEIIEPRLR